MPITSVYDPHAPYAWSIFHLSVFVYIVTLVILAVVVSLVAFACWRYRSSVRPESPAPAFGNLKIEVIYTAIPILLLIVIMTWTIRTMQGSDPTPREGRKEDIIVVGHQWWWEGRYPNSGVSSVHVRREVAREVILAFNRPSATTSPRT